MRYGALALSFLDHVASLGLSKATISKYAEYLVTVLRVIDFNPKRASRKDVERVVAWINSQPYKGWTKRDKKLVLKKLIQYAKYGSRDRDTPYPPEVSWIKVRSNYGDTRVTPDAFLTPRTLKSSSRSYFTKLLPRKPPILTVERNRSL
ncbi:hypothetical protein KEJ27_10360 [Candidatus Bathyarchaeota archaeon]|nr:hypothetical protein [Candidatus Bathyarchaeota archaeon]